MSGKILYATWVVSVTGTSTSKSRFQAYPRPAAVWPPEYRSALTPVQPTSGLMLKPEMGPAPTLVTIGVGSPLPVEPSLRSQPASWMMPPLWTAVTFRR